MKKTPAGRDGPEKHLRIGEFARLAGTSLRTLRFYESIGLLQPAFRSKGRFRYYHATDVHRLRTIQTLQQLGLGLEEIRELLSARPDELSHEAFVERVRESLRLQDELLEARIVELQARRDEVERALSKLADCSGCELHPGADNDYCDPCALDGEPLPVDLRARFQRSG